LRSLHKRVVVPATAAEVWLAWTTAGGARTFLAPDARIDLRIGGRYEILFDPSQPPGQQGTEGMRVLSYLPNAMLSVEWNAPPELPALRAGPPAWIVVQLQPVSDGATRVVLHHLGIGDDDEGARLEAYFRHAWDLVMAWLEQRFTSGPLDWSKPPPGSRRSYDFNPADWPAG
jgi:uncharacterized protein YndB with AHSA1/START domain